MSRLTNKIKDAWRVLFGSRFVIIYTNKDKTIDWSSFDMDLEDVQDSCDIVAENIDDIIQDYIDMEESDRVGQQMINMFHLN